MSIGNVRLQRYWDSTEPKSWKCWRQQKKTLSQTDCCLINYTTLSLLIHIKLIVQRHWQWVQQTCLGFLCYTALTKSQMHNYASWQISYGYQFTNVNSRIKSQVIKVQQFELMLPDAGKSKLASIFLRKIGKTQCFSSLSCLRWTEVTKSCQRMSQCLCKISSLIRSDLFGVIPKKLLQLITMYAKAHSHAVCMRVDI